MTNRRKNVNSTGTAETRINKRTDRDVVTEEDYKYVRYEESISHFVKQAGLDEVNYDYLWVRFLLQNEYDHANMSVKQHEGWDYVTDEDIDGPNPYLPKGVAESLLPKGVMVMGDLVLMRNHKFKTKARRKHFKDLQDAKSNAAFADPGGFGNIGHEVLTNKTIKAKW